MPPSRRRIFRGCWISLALASVQARNAPAASDGLSLDSFNAAALDQAQFSLLDTKEAEVSAPALRGFAKAPMMSEEVNSAGDMQVQASGGLSVLRQQAQIELAEAAADAAEAETLAAQETGPQGNAVCVKQEEEEEEEEGG
ncbi:unnamed protein product [Effrenium voratum]|nr:unnamed protein product [Effrenium voratum]